MLALSGTLLTIAAVWLWRRRLPRRWYGVALGGALLLASPYLISSLGRGITPPAAGVSVGLWLTWQLAHSGLRLGAHRPHRRAFPRRGAGGGSAAGASDWAWRSRSPPRSSGCWSGARGAGGRTGTPSCGPRRCCWSALPAPRWAAIAGIALVAGSSAALVTWGAELAGRIQVAQRDVARLGDGARSARGAAAGALRRAGASARRAPDDRLRDVRALARLGAGPQGYPAQLACGPAAARSLDELPLDSLDLPPSLLSTMVRDLAPGRQPAGHAGAAGARACTTSSWCGSRRDEVMTAAVGPALRAGSARAGWGDCSTRRAAGAPLQPDPGPAARSLRADAAAALASRGVDPCEASIRWTCPAARRTVHAAIDLRGPVPLFVRGVLVVLLDAGVLGRALVRWRSWWPGSARARPRWRSLARSFRIRLAVTLAAFFLLPALGFAAWSFARLAQEVERSRDLLITQTLRDAVLTAGGLVPGRQARPPDERLRELSRRIDADLALYRGGRLAATSTQVLEDLGVMPQLMDPDAFAAVALGGDLEVTRDGSIPALAERVGYRVIQPGTPAELGVLATPQLADDSSLGVRQLDLALVLLLADPGGRRRGAGRGAVGPRARSPGRWPICGVARSRWAGVSRCRRIEHPPLEFEPVFGAFERMAADIRSQPGGAGGGAAPHGRGARDGGDRRRRPRPRGPSADRQPAGGGPAGRLAGRRRARSSTGLGREWARWPTEVAPLPARRPAPRRSASSRSAGGASRSSSPRWARTCAASSSRSTT